MLIGKFVQKICAQILAEKILNLVSPKFFKKNKVDFGNAGDFHVLAQKCHFGSKMLKIENLLEKSIRSLTFKGDFSKFQPIWVTFSEKILYSHVNIFFQKIFIFFLTSKKYIKIENLKSASKNLI
jgi:hypothetical protein